MNPVFTYILDVSLPRYFWESQRSDTNVFFSYGIGMKFA